MGASTRKVAQVLEKMGGFELRRRLDDRQWLYLMVDATYVKARRHGASPLG